MSCYGASSSLLERRKSFSFAYFNRPISRTQSIWYANNEEDNLQYRCAAQSVVSGDYAEIDELFIPPQDDQVFLTPPETVCSSLDDVQMECDVHPDSDESFEDDCVHPAKLTALKCDSIAPPEFEWFHGYLDRPDAEYLLNKHEPGSYMVRISVPTLDTSTKYILTVRTSYGYQHFKIKTILGEYYINIYKFPTLGSIIGYFSQVSPLLAGLYLKSPLSPKRSVSREKRLKAKASYTPSTEDSDHPDILSFKKGDIFVTNDILNGDDCRWIRGRKEKSSESGLIMRVLVQEIAQDEEFYKYDWFHGRVTDAKVIEILRHEDEGRYVITNSGSSSYCMHVKTGSDIKSTHIYPQGDGSFVMGSQSHESLPKCIDERRKTIGNLSPVKRKNQVKSALYCSNLPPRSYPDVRVPAKWRQHKTDWKSIKVDFESDRENAVFLNVDKKGDKVEKCIPLKGCRVFEVDFNMFQVSHCLQVVVNGLNGEVQGHFLHVEDEKRYQELLSKLTNQAYQVDNGPTPPGKRVKSLRIKVCQAEGLDPLNLPGPAFCSVGFDGSAVQRTKEAHSGHSSKKLSWNETLHCKHANIINSNELKVKLCYSNKNKKPCVLEAATVPLTDLQNMDFKTDYYPLRLPIKGQNNSRLPKLRLELYYRDHAVLQPSYYHTLLLQLQRNNFSTLKLLRDMLRTCSEHGDRESRETLASVLLTIYDKTKVRLIKELISDDISRHPDNDSGSIFRDNTLTTALTVAHLNSPASKQHFEDVYKRIMDDMQDRVKARLETPSTEDARQLVQQDKDSVLSALIQSISQMPETVRSVVNHLLRELSVRWPQLPNIQSAVILNMMFVRFYLLRFVHPHDRDLRTMLPETVAAMLNVAKAIKRKDIDQYLIEFLRNSPDSSDNIPETEDLSGIKGSDGAHLFNLIYAVVQKTPSTVSDDDARRDCFNSLREVLDHLHSLEQNVH